MAEGRGQLAVGVGLEVLAANPLAEALFAPVYTDPGRPVNHARFTFLDPRARDFWIDWGRAAAMPWRCCAPGSSTCATPAVGELHLSYDVTELPADPGLSLIAFSAEPDSPDDDALRPLASWAATTDAGPVGGRR